MAAIVFEADCEFVLMYHAGELSPIPGVPRTMNRLLCVLIGLVLICGPALAIGKSDVRDIILKEYPGANITEIERETYRGQKVFEVDFQHGGEALEAILSLDGEFIRVGVDD